MSIARRLISVSGGELEPFQFQVTVGAGVSYGLPLYSVAGAQPNILVDWGDGGTNTITSTTDANRIHTYSSAGTYTVSITGSLPGFRVDNDTYRLLYSGIVQWGNVGIRSLNFYGCSNITSIPNGEQGLNRITSWNNGFRGTGITSIPGDLFDYSTLATEFTDTFSFTPVTSVPTGLFDNCTSAVSFNSTFSACLSLVSVPNELFRYNTSVLSFSSCFRNNRALTNIPTFQYNTQVTVFSNIFNMSSTSNGSSNWGTVETLWSRVPEPLGTNAFNNCTGITNYASIPLNWK